MSLSRTRIRLVALALLFLSACLPVIPAQDSLPTLSPAAPATLTPFQPHTETPTTSATSESPTSTPEPLPARVLILSLDGFRPDAIEFRINEDGYYDADVFDMTKRQQTVLYGKSYNIAIDEPGDIWWVEHPEEVEIHVIGSINYAGDGETISGSTVFEHNDRNEVNEMS